MEKNTLRKLQEEINAIKKRNKKVEAEKAWETSILRKLSILILTYSIVFIVMLLIWIEKPMMNAIIPIIWYLLSTISLWFLKKKYIENYNRNKNN